MTTEYSGSGDVHRSMELLWHLRDRPSRGPKPALTIDKIVTAAVKLADADGLEALSMRRVAAELGVGTMSLYRYVPGKSELLDLMLDHVVGLYKPEISDVDPDPRELLEGMARGGWQIYMEHPWYPFVDQARPIIGPNGLAAVEYVFRHLRKTGITDQEMVMVLSTIENFVMATARAHISAQQAELRTGVSNDEFWAAQEPALLKALETGQFPTMMDLHSETFSVLHEQIFEFGLARLLDGLDAFFNARRSGSA